MNLRGKKAIILDLDNTIYPVSSIGNELYASLFQLITENGEFRGEIEKIKADVMRIPFQRVATEYNFSNQLTYKSIQLLKDLTYENKMSPFEDYEVLNRLPLAKFLVTTGFLKLQHSKIRSLGIQQDFMEIHIIDPLASAQTKKEVFKDIMERHTYKPSDLLVIGDDPVSEIKAAQELEIDSVLYDKLSLHRHIVNTKRIENFHSLEMLW